MNSSYINEFHLKILDKNINDTKKLMAYLQVIQ